MKINLQFIGKNIRYLRREQGWTLATLAAMAGMSEIPLGRIERGMNAPSAAVIYSLSKALNVSVDTLFADGRQSFRQRRFENEKKPFLIHGDTQHPFTPQIKSMTQDIIEGFQALEDICGVQKHAKMPLFIPFEATHKGMTDLSLNARRYMGIEQGIIFDYFELFENQGFRVVVLPMPKDIDSFSYYDPQNQNAFFFLNTRKSSERQLFQLAYELGRVLIFTYTMQHGVELFQTDSSPAPSGNKPFTAHRAANRFAATFLMPAKAVRDTVRQLGIQKKCWSYELLLRIKHRFGISAETFLYRLNELDLIDPVLIKPLKAKIHDYYGKTDFGEPDLSRRLLTPNGRLWDLVITGKEVEEGRDEVMKIEQTLKKWKVVKK